ncbi:MAG: thioredoxin family protein [Candidatus Nanohaloarchaea archaeon]
MRDVKVEVFYSETCPNCPAQKELAKDFESDEVKVTMTNVARKNIRAKKHGVKSVPTTIISGPGLEQKSGFRGVMSEDKLETAIEVAKGEKDEEALESSIGDSIKSIMPF